MRQVLKKGVVKIPSTADVLFVAQQINLDLIALNKAYPDKLSYESAARYFNSYTTFLYNVAVKRLGFSIYDPHDDNLVYHEYRYNIPYGHVTSGGKGGRSVTPFWLPQSATFTAWVCWSDEMLRHPQYRQEQIVAGTQWNIPTRNGTFNGRYDGGNLDREIYGYDSLEVARDDFN